MSRALLRPLFCALAAAVFLSGCAGYPPIKPFFGRFGAARPPWESLEQPPVKSPETYWTGEGAHGEPYIVVRRGQQRAYFYRGKKVVGATRISTGKTGFTTPDGNYHVIQKDRHHVSTLYGEFVDSDGGVVKSNVDVTKDSAPEGASFRGAKMPYFLRFHGGYGLHAGHVPNRPASHGCVRLPAEMAKHFFENAHVGTPVRVVD